MLIQNQIMQIANTLDDKMMEWDKSSQERISKFDLLCKETPKDVKTSLLNAANQLKDDWIVIFDKTKKEHVDLIYKLDVESSARIREGTEMHAKSIIESIKENAVNASIVAIEGIGKAVNELDVKKTQRINIETEKITKNLNALNESIKKLLRK